MGTVEGRETVPKDKWKEDVGDSTERKVQSSVDDCSTAAVVQTAAHSTIDSLRLFLEINSNLQSHTRCTTQAQVWQVLVQEINPTLHSQASGAAQAQVRQIPKLALAC